MSRLIIKNLPNSLDTDDKFRAYFNAAHLGTITDAKIATKQDGTFRRFGFLGYKTPGEALKAKEFFNRSFVECRRIQVELVDAHKAREGSSIRPAKRSRTDSNLDQAVAGSSSSFKPLKTIPSSTLLSYSRSPNPKHVDTREEQQLARFLELLTPRSTANAVRTWGTDEGFGRNEHQHDHPWQFLEDEKREGGEDSGTRPGQMSDVDWLKSRMKNPSPPLLHEEGDEKMFQQSDDELKGDAEAVIASSKQRQKDTEEISLSPEEAERRRTTKQILTTGRLFLRNLTYSCSEDDLRDVFGKYGEIEQIHIPTDSKTHRSKGTAYIRYSKPPDALAAYEQLDGKDLQGRLVHILPALDPPSFKPAAVTDVDGASWRKSLKEIVMDKRKENAGKDFNWAMLYMNSDAVVSSIADRMRITKADILNGENGTTNPAVKLALAETHVIKETKRYFEENGISLDKFHSKGNTHPRRSNTVILVKNIPYGTSMADLQSLFGVHGEVKKLLIPPAGTMAVVEFEQVDEAERAFKGVAYKRMKNSIVYLEWAPEGVFIGGEGKVDSGVKPVRIVGQERSGEGEIEGEGSGGVKEEEVTSATLFVKNLNFKTTSDQLVSAFKGLPGFTCARIIMKPDPNLVNGTGCLSMGYGFVGFASSEDASKALQTMQGFMLDGHALLVNFAKRAGGGARDGASGSRGSQSLLGATKSSKIIVRNVPFEASKKDLKELFGAHGTLKSVRLPKKFDSRSRGFAFLEFVSRREAESTMETLKHTHLLGRHLVLEWAKEGEFVDVDELREKIKRSYVEEGKVLSGKKRKFTIGDDELGGEDGLEEGAM